MGGPCRTPMWPGRTSNATPVPQVGVTPGAFAFEFLWVLRTRAPRQKAEGPLKGSSTYPCSRPCQLFLEPSPLPGPPMLTQDQKSGCVLRVCKHITQHKMGRNIYKLGRK